MTKSTQQLADELARNCAELIVRKDHPKRSVLIECYENDIHSTIPLLELLEVARAINPLIGWWAFVQAGHQVENEGKELPEDAVALHYMGNGASTTVTVKQLNAMCKALTNLQNKVEL